MLPHCCDWLARASRRDEGPTQAVRLSTCFRIAESNTPSPLWSTTAATVLTVVAPAAEGLSTLRARCALRVP